MQVIESMKSCILTKLLFFSFWFYNIILLILSGGVKMGDAREKPPEQAQTELGSSTLFAQTCLFENLGSLESCHKKTCFQRFAIR